MACLRPGDSVKRGEIRQIAPGGKAECALGGGGSSSYHIRWIYDDSRLYDFQQIHSAHQIRPVARLV